jgi:2-isopropylmalate synthase
MVRKSSDKLWVSDTTLRDGLTDIQIRAEEKLRLLRLIDGIGVDSIEVGMTTADSTSDDALDDALGCVKRAVATVLAHPNPNAIARAGRALMSAVRPRLSVYNAVSDRTSIDSRGLMTELGKQRLEQIRSTVTIALEHCADVQWSALDATRAEPLFLCRAMETAIEAGATTVTISDTRGQALPEEIEALLNTMHQHVSGLASVRVSVHFHNDLGLATANVLAALQMGVRQVEGTLGGIGPHGGNTALEEVVSAVRQREDRFTLDSGMNLDAVGLIVSAVRAAGHK